MKWYRSVVSVLLAAIATFLVSCSSGSNVTAPTYSPDQLSQIEIYAGRIAASQQRLPELVRYIERKDWNNVDNFIHGPLGELRARMVRMANLLLPDDKKQATALAEEVGTHLEGISLAAQDYDFSRAANEYSEFERDLTALLNIVPEGARPTAEESTENNVYEMVTPAIEPQGERPDAEDMVRQPVLNE
ncbi:MAG: photosystem II protein PsbQ [Leptolyngbya sp. SIO4C1]|nr:photosystem II protein PsbQ [Leptolyngbya sp. SIO4C1]